MSSKKKLKSIVNSNKVLLSNVASLSTFQIINYFLPLVTFPYLVRVLGVEQFGIYVYIQTIINYFNVFVVYGFELSATNRIAQNTENKEQVNSVFSSVLIIKFSIILVELLVLFLLVSLITPISEYKLLYWYTFIRVIGLALFPSWFFQGVQDMKYVAIINGLSKVLFTILIFIVVKNSEDLDLAILSNSLGVLVAGIFSLFIAFKKFGVKLVRPKLSFILNILREGFDIFLSQLFVSIYTYSNIVILEMYVSKYLVGVYAVGVKIFEALSRISYPVITAMYPILSRSYLDDELVFDRKVKKLELILISGFSIATILLFIFSDFLYKIVAGNVDEYGGTVIKILSIAFLAVPFASLYTKTLIIKKRSFYLSRITLVATFVNLILIFVLVQYWGIIGAAATVSIVLAFIALTKMYYTKKI